MLNPGEIRLLHIVPGDGSQIACNISVVSLDSSPPYHALSYTWGSQDLSHEITVSGEPYRVTSNLYGALKHLRYDDQERTIWIDAICINQRDDAERTAQVKMMADIYRRAEQVIMWVGEETEFDGMAFALLEQLKGIFEEHGHVDFDFQQTGPSGTTNPGYGLPNTGATDWIALARLFLRPYFERIWVVQEVVMATKAILVCGSFKIEWQVIRDLARSLQKGGSLGNLEYEETASGIVSVNVMADLKAGSGIDLLSLLVKTRAYKATESVDKVFALMNLASNLQDCGVKVDYSVTAPEVWQKLAIHSLAVHKSLLCLSNAGMYSSSQQSWVPDWSDADEHRGCLALYGKDRFRASGDTKASLSISDDSQTLTVQGFIVDTIAVVAPSIRKSIPRARTTGPLIWFEPGEEQARALKEATEVQAAIAATASAFQYSEGVSRHRELVRTLCCDILTTGEAANIDDAFKFYQWFLTFSSRIPLAPGADAEALVREADAAKPPDVRMEQFMHSVVLFGTGRSVCATKNGDLGRVPFGTQAGDLVCIFKGAVVPHLLRPENGHYKLVGECYINGIMYGQALERQDLVEQKFEIR